VQLKTSAAVGAAKELMIKSQVLSVLLRGGNERGQKEIRRMLAAPARCRFAELMRNREGLPAIFCRISANGRANPESVRASPWHRV
jgi:hypothetical protein